MKKYQICKAEKAEFDIYKAENLGPWTRGTLKVCSYKFDCSWVVAICVVYILIPFRHNSMQPIAFLVKTKVIFFVVSQCSRVQWCSHIVEKTTMFTPLFLKHCGIIGHLKKKKKLETAPWFEAFTECTKAFTLQTLQILWKNNGQVFARGQNVLYIKATWSCCVWDLE